MPAFYTLHYGKKNISHCYSKQIQAGGIQKLELCINMQVRMCEGFRKLHDLGRQEMIRENNVYLVLCVHMLFKQSEFIQLPHFILIVVH